MRYILIIIGVCCWSACAVVPKNTNSDNQVERIQTGMGPEDMVLDEISGNARLLLSCNDHRLREKAPMGNIYQVDLRQDSLNAAILPRVQEPAGLIFHPHGIDLLKDERGKNCLYVISHDNFMDRHFVFKYEVFRDSLLFLAAYEHKLMNTPNAVVARRDGGFYISNDHGKRGNQMELILRQKKGNIVYCDKDTNWVTVADKLLYPNGLSVDIQEYSKDSVQRHFYVATTIHNHIFRYDMDKHGNLANRKKIAKVVGGDNLRQDQNLLLVGAHLKIFAFVGHFKNPNKLSPTVIYGVHKERKERHLLYANEGKQISAGATAILYKGDLFISQVFQPFLLKVKIDKEKYTKILK